MASLTNRLKTLFIAGTLIAGTAGVAAAADLDLPPPPVAPLPEAPAFSGWYLRGDVGVGINQLISQSSTFEEGAPVGFAIDGSGLGEQATLGVGAGYQFNNWFRADVTGEYRTGSRYWALEDAYNGGDDYVDRYSGSVSSAVFLANGYVDAGTWYGVTPYVGGGVGVSYNMLHGLTDYGYGASYGGYGVAPDKNAASFAWALMAGLTYSLTPNWMIDFSYRYLDMGKISSNQIQCTASCNLESQSFRMTSNDIRIGLRYVFAEVPPMAPQLPVVSKY